MQNGIGPSQEPMDDVKEFTSVPPNWTAERDLLFYEERWENEALSYAEGLRRAMVLHCGGLTRMINATLSYFYDHDLTLFPFPPECLTVTEKLNIIESIVQESSRDAGYRERLQRDISFCRRAEAERTRVFAEHHKRCGKSWLYPLVAAIDVCGAAAFGLEETMVCEHDDFVTSPLE